MRKEKLDAERQLFKEVTQRFEEHFVLAPKGRKYVTDFLDGFDLLSGYGKKQFHKITEFRGGKNKFVVLLVEKEFVEENTFFRRMYYYNGDGRQKIDEMEPVVLFKIPENLGEVMIKPETLVDKVSNFFIKVDVDFEEYPAFSKNYFLAANHPELVKAKFPSSILNVLEVIEGLSMEIHGNLVLLTYGKSLTEDVLLFIISVANKMTSFHLMTDFK